MDSDSSCLKPTYEARQKWALRGEIAALSISLLELFELNGGSITNVMAQRALEIYGSKWSTTLARLREFLSLFGGGLMVPRPVRDPNNVFEYRYKLTDDPNDSARHIVAITADALNRLNKVPESVRKARLQNPSPQQIDVITVAALPAMTARECANEGIREARALGIDVREIKRSISGPSAEDFNLEAPAPRRRLDIERDLSGARIRAAEQLDQILKGN